MGKRSPNRISIPTAQVGPRVTLPTYATKRPDDCHPVFSFEYMVDTHSVETCQKDECASLALKLFKLSRLTWQQINQAPRHGLGFEIIKRDCINAPIPNIVTPEVNLVAFRFHRLAPMVGFRRDHIFFIIWLDRDFTLYDHS